MTSSRAPFGLRLRLADQQLVEGDAQLVLLDDAVARHHADGEHRGVRTGLPDDARDERAVAGLAVEQAELGLQDDAGHLGVGHVVTDADRLSVDRRAQGRVSAAEPAVLAQAGVEDGDDRTPARLRRARRDRRPAEPRDRNPSGDRGTVDVRSAERRPVDIGGAERRPVDVGGAHQAWSIDVRDALETDPGQRHQVVQPDLERVVVAGQLAVLADRAVGVGQARGAGGRGGDPEPRHPALGHLLEGGAAQLLHVVVPLALGRARGADVVAGGLGRFEKGVDGSRVTGALDEDLVVDERGRLERPPAAGRRVGVEDGAPVPLQAGARKARHGSSFDRALWVGHGVGVLGSDGGWGL